MRPSLSSDLRRRAGRDRCSRSSSTSRPMAPRAAATSASVAAAAQDLARRVHERRRVTAGALAGLPDRVVDLARDVGRPEGDVVLVGERGGEPGVAGPARATQDDRRVGPLLRADGVGLDAYGAPSARSARTSCPGRGPQAVQDRELVLEEVVTRAASEGTARRTRRARPRTIRRRARPRADRRSCGRPGPRPPRSGPSAPERHRRDQGAEPDPCSCRGRGRRA